ncbi:hypothetical protein D9M68_408400 [compost metagenome]
MHCRKCEEPALDNGSGLCEFHFEAQRAAIRSSLAADVPSAAVPSFGGTPKAVEERPPIPVLLGMGLTMAITMFAVLGMAWTEQSPMPWLMASAISGLVTVATWRSCMKRFPKFLGPVVFLAVAALAACVLAFWLAQVLTRPSSSSELGGEVGSASGQGAAWFACREAALQRFKTPTQAESEMFPVAFNEIGNSGIYAIQGKVQAPNSFGVKLQHLVVCEGAPDGDPSRVESWKIHSVSVIQ